MPLLDVAGPCLLMMNVIAHGERERTEEESQLCSDCTLQGRLGQSVEIVGRQWMLKGSVCWWWGKGAGTDDALLAAVA